MAVQICSEDTEKGEQSEFREREIDHRCRDGGWAKKNLPRAGAEKKGAKMAAVES